MSTRLIIEGNAVYEIDEDCQSCRNKRQGERMRQASCGNGKRGKQPAMGNTGMREKRPAPDRKPRSDPYDRTEAVHSKPAGNSEKAAENSEKVAENSAKADRYSAQSDVHGAKPDEDHTKPGENQVNPEENRVKPGM